ncbi:hypothetical protein NPIL_271051 [Nephila pilipes]|uniref:Uncharacterized protein n=1 Tax=Nephila pilipes TaxID=299642 RepID=A0A8X6QTE4_NEPPI|nr:hypothetical protein NPIL_271051 [Nephila pilipes]
MVTGFETGNVQNDFQAQVLTLRNLLMGLMGFAIIRAEIVSNFHSDNQFCGIIAIFETLSPKPFERVLESYSISSKLVSAKTEGHNCSLSSFTSELSICVVLTD